MNSFSVVFLVAALVFALLDWVAVARGALVLEFVSKPATTVAFLAAAATFDVLHDTRWWLALAALAFCFLGDVFLMLPGDFFLQGLASFAVAQLLFMTSFLFDGPSGQRFLVGILVTTPVALFLSHRLIRAILLKGLSDLVVPVVIYVVLISAMAVGAISAGNWVAILGAFLFMVSDSFIAESRFVSEHNWHSVSIMVTYHLALAGLIFGLF